MKAVTKIVFLDDNGEKFFGEGPFQLLKAVEETGSLRAAAMSMNMAYTKAMKVLKNAESALGFALTERTTGGKSGGGSKITPEGKKWLDRYENYRNECRQVNGQLYDENFSARTGCIIMASGLGKRFGENKLMADFMGRPMISHVLDATEGLFDKRVVVTRHEDVARLCRERNIKVIVHDLPHRSDTVRLGLEALGEMEHYMFCPADQPLIRRKTVAELLRCAASDREKIWRTSSEGVSGSPVIFPGWARSELTELPEGKGGSWLIKKYPEKVACMEVRNEYELMDVDTREALEQAETIGYRNKKIDNLVIVRGGGDLATGTIYKLKKSGFAVLILETEKPSAIRRNVAFSEAVYAGQQTVEDMTCYLASSPEQAVCLLAEDKLPLIVDPSGESIDALKPMAVVDAILAKKNLGTRIDMAPVTVGLGPGFEAGKDVTCVVETKRGHSLGRVLWSGSAEPDTGIPGIIGGYGRERVLRSPAEGIIRNVKNIADEVKKGDVIALVETSDGRKVPVEASLDGQLRGLIRDGYPVTEGFKIADIDPRLEEYENCFTISDKARCIAGGVIEAIMQEKGRLNL